MTSSPTERAKAHMSAAKARHTPTPWDKEHREIYAGSARICRCITSISEIAEANAALIVRAVNTYVARDTALRHALDALRAHQLHQTPIADELIDEIAAALGETP